MRAYIFLFSIVLISTSSFCQTFAWDDKGKGTVTFDETVKTLLFIDFNQENVNYEKLHNELVEILANSGLNYKLITKADLEESIYSDLNAYPVVVDQYFYSTTASNGMTYSYMSLVFVERKTAIEARAFLTARSTKYCSAYETFLKKINKGKSIKVSKK